MALTEEQKLNVYKRISKYLSRNRIPTSLLKSELKAVVDGIDDWVDFRQTEFNSYIPEPARTVLTAKEKVQFLKEVVAERWEVS